jgi:hypothetical protein
MLKAYGGETQMPKAGKYVFPFYDLDACIKKLKEFHEKMQSDKATRSVVADALNMAEKGGAFLYLLSSMENFGLIQTGGGYITVTDLGKLVMYGNPKEVSQTKSKAVTNVELFREIASKYGKNPQEEQIKLFLRQKANVDIAKAQKLAPKVNKIYKKVSNYITSAEKLAPPTKEAMAIPAAMPPGLGRRDMIVQPEPSVVELLKIQFGDVYIQIPSDKKSLDSIKLAKDALTFMEQRLLEEKKQTKAA